MQRNTQKIALPECFPPPHSLKLSGPRVGEVIEECRVPHIKKEVPEIDRPRAPVEKQFFYDTPSFAVEFRGSTRYGGKSQAWEILLVYCARVSAKSGKKCFPDFMEHVNMSSGETCTVLTLPAHCGYNAIYAEARRPSDGSYIDELMSASHEILTQLCFVHMTAAYFYDLALEEFSAMEMKDGGSSGHVTEKPIACVTCSGRRPCSFHQL